MEGDAQRRAGLEFTGEGEGKKKGKGEQRNKKRPGTRINAHSTKKKYTARTWGEVAARLKEWKRRVPLLFKLKSELRKNPKREAKGSRAMEGPKRKGAEIGD